MAHLLKTSPNATWHPRYKKTQIKAIFFFLKDMNDKEYAVSVYNHPLRFYLLTQGILLFIYANVSFWMRKDVSPEDVMFLRAILNSSTLLILVMAVTKRIAGADFFLCDILKKKLTCAF
jgi:hypothetical protein